MVPPKAMGTLTYIAKAGEYTIDDTIFEIEFGEHKTEYGMLQSWPVRSPRPYTEKLAGDTPLLTGQRVLDALFPYFFFIDYLFANVITNLSLQLHTRRNHRYSRSFRLWKNCHFSIFI